MATDNLDFLMRSGLVAQGNATITGNTWVGGNLTVLGTTNLGSVSNVVITGGTLNYVLTTNGNGGLSWQAVSTLQSPFNGGTITNALVISNATVSTTTTTGALVVNSGGAGIVGNLNVGGSYSTFAGNVNISGQLNVTGNIVGSSVTVFQGNTGVFYGNAQGIGALYGGVTGYTPLPDTVFQSTGNANFYIQNNFQNLNTGNQASTDWVATSGSGTDTTNYIDMGITASGWDGTQSNSLGNALRPNDAYLYAQGGTGGGNLVVGASSAGMAVRILAGGNTASFVTATFNAPNTATTSSTTGSLVLTGGMGITGNINVSATATIGSNATINGGLTVNAPSVFNGNITVNGLSQLGPVGNVKITGGYSGNVLTTDGSGNLSWVSVGSLGNGFNGGTITNGLTISNATASTSTTTGALVVNSGGAGIVGNVYVGNSLVVQGTTQASTATTGAVIVSGGVGIAKDLVVGGNLTINGSITYINSNVAVVEDPSIAIGTGPNGAPLTSNDSQDRGVEFHYYANNGDKYGFFGWQNSTGAFEFISNASVTGGVYSPAAGTTYGSALFGAMTLSNTLVSTSTSTGALIIQGAGGAGIGGNVNVGQQLNVTGVTTLSSVLNVAGNIRASGNLTVLGATNLGSVSNVTITGGSSNYVLTTNGSGGLSWQAVSALTSQFNGGTITNALVISNAAVSTSTTTGALVVNSGGAGIVGNVYVGNTMVVQGGAATTGSGTGALQVSTGGASIAGNIWVGGSNSTVMGTLTVFGNVNIPGVINGAIYQMTGNTAASTSSVIVDTWAAATYQSASYLVQVKEATTNNTQFSRYMVMSDGTNVWQTEYAVLIGNVSLGTTTAALAGGTVSVSFAPTNTNYSKTIRIKRDLLQV